MRQFNQRVDNKKFLQWIGRGEIREIMNILQGGNNCML